MKIHIIGVEMKTKTNVYIPKDRDSGWVDLYLLSMRFCVCEWIWTIPILTSLENLMMVLCKKNPDTYQNSQLKYIRK